MYSIKLLEEMNKLYGKYGVKIEQVNIRSIKISMGNADIPDSAIDIEKMRATEKLDSSVIVFNECMEELSSYKDKDAYYIWISTGLEDKEGKVIYLGLVPNLEKGGMWCYFVGNYDRLSKRVERYIKDNNTTLEEIKKKNAKKDENTLLEEVLKITGKGKETAAMIDVYMVSAYLKAVGAKIRDDVKNNKDRNLRYNRNKSKICYKISLEDEYGCDIVIMQEIKGTELGKREVVQSRKAMIEAGFQNADYDISPVIIYNTTDELVICPRLEEFDLEDRGSLKHVLEERIDRFPENVRGYSRGELYNLLYANIQHNVKRCARDYRWALPFYNIKENSIQYLMPLYTNGRYDGKADIAMVVRKDEYFRVATVLTVEAAYANASVLANITSEWCRV